MFYFFIFKKVLFFYGLKQTHKQLPAMEEKDINKHLSLFSTQWKI